MKIEDYIEKIAALDSDYKGTILHCAELDNEHNILQSAQLVHYALGLATEALECIEAQKKGTAAQLEELSDICWFAGNAARVLGNVPAQEDVARYPKSGVTQVYALCELFASRIKSAIAYGRADKPTDKSPDYWTTIPAEIFARVLAITNSQGGLGSNGILDLNIRKLEARHGKKFNATGALARDIPAEQRAMAFTSENIPQPAKKPAAPAAPATGDLAPLPNPVLRGEARATASELQDVFGKTTKLSDLLRKKPNEGFDINAPAGDDAAGPSEVLT